MFSFIASTATTGSAISFFGIWMSICAIWFLYLIASFLKETIQKRNPSMWNYKFYKKHSYLINYQAEELLTKLGNGNFSEDQINKIINDFNKLDPKARCKIDAKMIEFQKQLFKEGEPARALSEKKRNFVNAIE